MNFSYLGSPCSGDIEDVVVATDDKDTPMDVVIYNIIEVGGSLVRNKVLSKITQARLLLSKIILEDLIFFVDE